jgi:glyoxylase-like metal-dependent hydrolase (beta-lactamase superfamily II)
MQIKQFRVGIDNFSYLIQCTQTRKCALIDPGNNASEAMKFIGSENLELVFVIDTHHHRDHTADNARVASLYHCDIVSSEVDAALLEGVTRFVSDGESLMLGNVRLEFLLTPGHTPGGLCVLADGKALFTGDTLFIGDCGRTDLEGGSNRKLFASLQRLKSLPDDVIVYSGHDYGGVPFDSLGNQKKRNRALLAASLDEFQHIP